MSETSKARTRTAMAAAAARSCGLVPTPGQHTMTDPRFRIRPMQQVVSACTGAMITACFMTPLDVIKTRLQAQQSAMLSNKCFLYCNGLMDHICPCGPNTPTPTAASQNAFSKLSAPASSSSHFTGTIDAFVKISRSEGIAALWSGLSPTLISALPSTIIYFVAYEQFKARFTDLHYKYLAPMQSRDIPMLVPLLAGVSARILAVTFVSPIEMIRTKMQSQKMTHAEMFGSVRQVVQSQGVLGLWRGLPPTILRDVPFSGIYWTCYEYLKSRFNVVEPTFGFSFVAGAISGSVAATVTTPFDVIKTHEQIEFGEKVIFTDNPAKSVPTKSVAERLSNIYRLNGMRGIFSGLGPRLFKVAPACAIMISTFEYSKSFFYHYNVDQHQQSMLLLTNSNNSNNNNCTSAKTDLE
ncbi:probable mitochondrial glutathione transporter SLC25A40 isoform X3 [Drosophila sulfurigaster albostrigata]|uniref:probable mitochondrial glutathione transporter SLC25A40 isoform X3 n=1 Tax=Drosophila sulfurigaster albostrigata TaxID=89887 RepID=UPI002D2196DF|nr:probable mitochondrial glutathione transporter SLC25A40 isoform X3 [Drosophila sulfurigaster albostrigata]